MVPGPSAKNPSLIRGSTPRKPQRRSFSVLDLVDSAEKSGLEPDAKHGASGRPLARQPAIVGLELGIVDTSCFVLPESKKWQIGDNASRRSCPLFEELLRVPRWNSQVGSTKSIQDCKINSNYFSIMIKKRPTRSSRSRGRIVNNFVF